MENVKLLECPPALFLILYELIQLTDHKAPRYIFVFTVLLLLPLSVVSTLELCRVGFNCQS
jgi:hypothetical protein